MLGEWYMRNSLSQIFLVWEGQNWDCKNKLGLQRRYAQFYW
jgi:hypothetical protein